MLRQSIDFDQPKPRVLMVGETECPALRQALAACGKRWLATHAARVADAREHLADGPAFDATLLLADRPRAVDPSDRDALLATGNPGEVVTLAGPWFEGALRQQGRAGDPSVVYWHALAEWLDARFRQGPLSADCRPPGVVLVGSRDWDTASAIGDALEVETSWKALGVVWSPRRGRSPFVSRVDVGVWVGGQLDGPAAAELDAFVKRVRNLGGGTVALIDFPRHDEVATALAIGARSVLAKPWSTVALSRALQRAAGRAQRPVNWVPIFQGGFPLRSAA